MGAGAPVVYGDGMQVLSSRVLLRPADLDAAVEFYERRLGLVRYHEWGNPRTAASSTSSVAIWS